MITTHPEELHGALDAAHYTYLGWQSNWEIFNVHWLNTHKPKYVECMAEAHQRHEQQVTPSQTITSCDTCRIYWFTDTGD